MVTALLPTHLPAPRLHPARPAHSSKRPALRALAATTMSDLVDALAMSPARDGLVEDAVVWASQHGLVRVVAK